MPATFHCGIPISGPECRSSGGQAQPGAAYPLNWILFLLPLEEGHIAGWALAWYYVFIHLMAAGFCYLFCRSVARSPRTASLAGGIIFSLSGYLGNVAWPQMINGAVWIPLVFLFQLRAGRGRPFGNAALSGMFLGVAFLSGHHQVPIFTAVAWAGVWIYLLVKDRRLLAPTAAALLFAALAGALQTLPAYEYGRLARRWVSAPEPIAWNQPVPYSVHATYDLKAFSLFGIVFPGVKVHHDPFVGVVALVLALLAIATLWRDTRVRLLAALGGAALLYALGHNSVFQGALYGLIPELEKARSASSIVVLFQFTAAALAAFGIDTLVASWTARATWILAGFGALTLAIAEGVIFANRLTFPGDDRVILTAIVALLAAALFVAWQRQAVTATQAHVLLFLLLFLELGNTGQYSLVDRSDRGQMQWLDQDLRALRYCPVPQSAARLPARRGGRRCLCAQLGCLSWHRDARGKDRQCLHQRAGFGILRNHRPADVGRSLYHRCRPTERRGREGLRRRRWHECLSPPSRSPAPGPCTSWFVCRNPARGTSWWDADLGNPSAASLTW